MTEDEAKTKWCPFARVVTDFGDVKVGPFNRDDMVPGSGSTEDIISQALCIGSACMAWRWAFPAEIEWNKNQAGYCGLAGKDGLGTLTRS